MFPRIQLRINDRIIIDSEDFVSKVEGSVLNFSLKDSDTFPATVDSELVAIGGWKLNAVSLIHSRASSEMVIKGWKSLGQLIPMDRLLIPFLYSTGIDYVRFNISGVEPKWARLLRLCYWYEKCLGLDGEDFRYKQTEIKRAILKPLRNVEKTIDNEGKGFLSATEQLSRTISSYTSELAISALTNGCGSKVSFDKKHDFIFDTFPCEVKSLYSHMTIEREKDETPKLNIHGQTLGEKVNSYGEFFKFIFSKKALAHISKAYSQGGKFVFLDVTNTFASVLMYLLSTENEIDLSFSKALNNAVNLAKNTKEKLPVVVVSSVSSYEHQTIAFVVPIPLQLINL
jgi:hypothetical protein